MTFDRGGNRCTLLFHAMPQAALFVQEFRPARKANTASFFEDLAGLPLQRIHLDPHDRIVIFDFGQFELRFIMFGPGANVFLCSQGQVIDAYRSADFPVLAPPAQPSLTAVEKAGGAKAKVLAADPRFPRHLIPWLDRGLQFDRLSAPQIMETVATLTREMLQNPSFRRLSDGGICLLGPEWVHDAGARSFPDVNALIRGCWLDREIRSGFVERRDRIAGQLSAALAKLGKMEQELRRAPDALSRANHYEQMGHILMVYSGLENPSSEEVVLDDPFHPGDKVRISLKKGQSFSENAQVYYMKARNTRKSIEASRDRMVEIQRKSDHAARLLRSFESVDGPKTLERWLKEHADAMRRLVGAESAGQASAAPWRVVPWMGYEVWIGKSAASNDLLTKAAHKEDIWMHARHVSGSHVVIRMGRRTEFPPKEVIEGVASWAAFFSKAKSSALVPVSYTKRKHVRKPKGAAPGAVLVEREQVVLVAPEKPASISDSEP